MTAVGILLLAGVWVVIGVVIGVDVIDVMVAALLVGVAWRDERRSRRRPCRRAG